MRALQTPVCRTVRASASRGFHSTQRRAVDAEVLPAKRPVGAFRGGLVGFAMGSILTGGTVYYYVLNEYKVSNELLTEDIYSLQAAVQRTHAYCQTLEEKIDAQKKK